MKSTIFSRIVALILCTLTAFSVMPVTAFADVGDGMQTDAAVYGDGTIKSEIAYDFEDADIHGFYRSTGIGYNYICAGGETFLATAENGHVRNGRYALGFEIDYSDSLESGFLLGTLNFGETRIFENAKSIGMWIYLPDEAVGLRIDPKFYSVDADGNHIGTTGGYANIGDGKTETGFVYELEESGWHYISMDVSSYDRTAFLKNNQMLQLYVSQKDGTNGYRYGEHSSVNGRFTFYVDDITVDYVADAADRMAPVFGNVVYRTSAMSESAILRETTVTDNTLSFSASVTDAVSGIDAATAEVSVDGVDHTDKLVWTDDATMALNGVTLADGRHLVRFSVCDKAGNLASVIREITVNSPDNAPVKVVAHDPTADRILLGSLYYVDVVAAAVERVDAVTVTLDLNSVSTWHLDHMVVTRGFTASYTLVADENVATLTIERIGETDLTGEAALVSIPIRTWELEPITAKADHPGKVWMYPDYKSANDILPMDVRVETDGGTVLFTDGTTATFASPTVQVNTELCGNAATSGGSASMNYIRNEAWYTDWNGGHDHRVETHRYYAEGATNIAVPVALEDKEPTAAEDGYTGRTYCEVCHSIVDFGTILPATGEPAVKEGLTWDEDGEIRYYKNGEPFFIGVVQDDAGNYYYINSSLKAIKNTIRGIRSDMTNGLLSPHYTYTFDENGVITNPVPLNPPPAPDEPEPDEPVTPDEPAVKEGLTWDEDGEIRYYKNGEPFFIGVVQDDAGNYYYINSSLKAIKNTIRGIRSDMTNGLLSPHYTYTFDENGVITNPVPLNPPPAPDEPETDAPDEPETDEPAVKEGLTWDEDGEIRYYKNGEPFFIGVVQDDAGNYYYINSSLKAIKNTIRGIRSDMTNGLLSPHYTYTFDENGVITNPVPLNPPPAPDEPEPDEPVTPDEPAVKEGLTWDEDGEIRYYENGTPVAIGVVQDDAGNYYYISSSLKATKSTTRTIRSDMTNGLLSPHFAYTFDENGVITNPVPLTLS